MSTIAEEGEPIGNDEKGGEMYRTKKYVTGFGNEVNSKHGIKS